MSNGTVNVLLRPRGRSAGSFGLRGRLGRELAFLECCHQSAGHRVRAASDCFIDDVIDAGASVDGAHHADYANDAASDDAHASTDHPRAD